MENIINLEQLDYRDQLIKDYIDEQQKSTKQEIKEYVDEKVQPSPTKSSGDVYYDYATWQKPYVRRGSNVIFAKTKWDASLTNISGDVFLEVGCLESNTPADEDTRVTYTGSIESTPLKPLLSHLQSVVEANELHILVENPLNYDDYTVEHCDCGIINDVIQYMSKMPALIDLVGLGDFIQAIEGGTDVNLTMNFPRDDNGRDPCRLRLYVCVDMSMAMRDDESNPDFYSCFVNIYSDKNSGEWKFKITPQQTVKVKYHRTQFTVANEGICRSKYVGFEDYHTHIKPEEFLRQIIGDYDPDSDAYNRDSFYECGLFVRRCVKNYEPEKVARSCQFRWTYKPTTAEGDYIMKIAKATGMYYLDKFGDDVALASSEYHNNIKSDMKWFARSNKIDNDGRSGKWGLYRRGAYIDFLVTGDPCFGKAYHYKGFNEETGYRGIVYYKIRFTNRPMHIRIMSIVDIDKETIRHKVKYLGNVDPLKIPY